MKYLIILVLFCRCFLFAQQSGISGTVTDSETLLPLQNANLVISGKPLSGTASGLNGKFSLAVDVAQQDTLIISYVGYETKVIPLSSIDDKEHVQIYLVPKVIPSQSVLIKGSLGQQGVTPLAFDKVTRSSIEETYTVQDIPAFLSSLPSATFYSENGNGIGYNYLSIRGFDQRRISVSINGIPQNDPEDHNVYWLDIPDLLGSTELIQVQRGAGSGVFGYPAIGGSINIITSVFSNNPHVDLSVSTGSYNTRKYSASFSSGLIAGKYSIYAKLSQILSSGYRDLSWVKFNSYHFSAVRYDDNFTTQVNFYGGPISDGLAYNGIAKFAIKDKQLRKDNFSYWESDENSYTYTTPRKTSEIENYSQPHFELMNEFQLNKNVTINSALFLVLGSGFFDYDGSWVNYLSDDPVIADSLAREYFRLTPENGFDKNGPIPQNTLIRAQVDNTQFGWIPRASIKHNNGELIFGAEFRNNKSDHWGSIRYAENIPPGVTPDYRYYFYNGSKDIFSVFAHESYSFSDKLNLLAEFQIAYHKYRLYNELYVGNDFHVSNVFYNPRAGLNYKLNDIMNVFFSAARVSREPRLNDYYDAAESGGGAVPQFEKNADGTYDFNNPIVKPETMTDFEIGGAINSKNYSLTLNLFYMLFNDEIVKNGKIDRFGQPITGNADKTVHKGIELSGLIRFLNSFELFANATYSQNKIENGNEFIVYNIIPDSTASAELNLNGNKISGFPEFLANIGLSFKNSGFYFRLAAKYTGSFYSDNYDNYLKNYLAAYPGFVPYTDNKNEAYFTADFFGSYETNLLSALTPSKIFFQVTNIFNSLYSANAIGGEFFPAAERNFLIGIQLGL